jgi:NitT/TauT family transport system ATP-binding protein
MTEPSGPGKSVEPCAPAAVVVRDLGLTFPGKHRGGEVRVLERIDIDVRVGEFVCLVGPSGCGKTTLLNVIAGFQKASRGEVYVQGEPVRGPDRRRIYIFQEGGVFPWLTVGENVALGLVTKTETERRGMVQHYLDMVGLMGFERVYPRQLSGGMRQRVELARALAADPAILYMDEPFGALDYFTRFKMRADLMRIWQRERKTVLFVTHDIDEAVQLADRIIVLSPRPASIQAIVDVDLPRPRDTSAPGYLQVRARILGIMGMNLWSDPATCSPDSGNEGNTHLDERDRIRALT